MAKNAQLKVVAKAQDEVTPTLKQIKASFKNLEKSTKDFKDNFSGLSALTFTPILGALSAGALILKDSIASSVEYASSVDDVSKALGIGAESLQEFRYAAQLSGSSAQEMDNALSILNRNLANVAAGSNKNLAELLKHLGIATKDANGNLRTTADILPELADAMKKQDTATQKAYIATQAFGKSGQSLIPLLEGGSEALEELNLNARKYGAVLNQDLIEKTAQMGDSFDNFSYATQGLKNSIGAQLIPVVQPLLDDFTDWIAINREWIATDIANAVKDLSISIKEIDFKACIKGTTEFIQSSVSLFNAIGGLKTIGIAIAAVFGTKVVIGTYKTITAFAALTSATINVIKILPALSGPLGLIGKGALFVGKGFGSILKLIPIAIPLIKGLGLAFMGFSKALLFTPIGWILGAIAALGAAVYLIYKNWDTVGPYFKAVWNGVTLPFKIGWELIKTLWDSLCDLPGVLMSGSFSELENWFTSLFTNIGGAITTPIDEAYTFLADLVPNGIKEAWQGVGDFIGNIWGKITSFIPDGFDFGFFNNDTPKGNVSNINPTVTPLNAQTLAMASGQSSWQGDMEIKVTTDNNTKAEVVKNKSSNNNMNITTSGALRG